MVGFEAIFIAAASDDFEERFTAPFTTPSHLNWPALGLCFILLAIWALLQRNWSRLQPASSSHHATQTFSTTLFTIVMACHLDHRNVCGLKCSKDLPGDKQSFHLLILPFRAECKLETSVYELNQWVSLGSILPRFLGTANMLVFLLSEPMLRTHLVNVAASA